MSKTLETLRTSRPWIGHIDDERNIGNSIIVSLVEGFEFSDDPGCGVKGFDTVTDARNGTRKTDVLACNKYNPKLGQAGFMDLVVALDAHLKTPDSVALLACMPQDQREAALLLGDVACKYIALIESRETRRN
jgi:hypothetical protein